MDNVTSWFHWGLPDYDYIDPTEHSTAQDINDENGSYLYTSDGFRPSDRLYPVIPVKLPVGHWRPSDDLTGSSSDPGTVICLILIGLIYLISIALLVATHYRKSLSGGSGGSGDDGYDRLEFIPAVDDCEDPDHLMPRESSWIKDRINVIIRTAFPGKHYIRKSIPTEVI